MTSAAFKNALRVLLAVGGSTNGIIHITAVAGRLGIEVDLASFDEMGKETPVLIDLKPSGQYYMDDLYRAGGLGAILRELKPLLNLDCLTITGRTLGEEIDASPEAFSNIIEFITLTTSGEVTDFGDATGATHERAGCSDVHGGLG